MSNRGRVRLSATRRSAVRMVSRSSAEPVGWTIETPMANDGSPKPPGMGMASPRTVGWTSPSSTAYPRSVAGLLAGQLGWDFQEGDDLHSAENVEKMASGQPLTDDDRWPWLDAVASWIREHDFAGIPGIVTCSALKRSYRDRLRGPHVVFVYLAGSRDEIRNRLSARMNHYMPSALLDSQLACLEPPTADERVSHDRRRRAARRDLRRDHPPAWAAPRTVLIGVGRTGSRLLVGASVGRLMETDGRRRVTLLLQPSDAF